MFDFAEPRISLSFLQKAAGILGDTDSGLSGLKIVDAFNHYADKWDVNVPYAEYPWGAVNKRTALYENLKAFSPSQQFAIIAELCDHPSFAIGAPSKGAREALKLRLYSKYSELRPEADTKELDLPLIEEARHWLDAFPESLKLFDDAKLKYDHGALQRNLLDDLRLSLELLLRAVLGNARPLEKQIAEIGSHLKAKGVSPQVTNMFQKLLDYYTKYQNDYVKHDDSVREEEVEFVFEITASFMKHIIRVSS